MVRMQNAVLVSHCKFTLDQMNSNFTKESPAPAKLAQQTESLSKAYDVLNAAYAVQQKSKETADIAALDKEGDQLIKALKGTIAAAQRMSFDPQRVAAAQSLGDTYAKYSVDASENLISEWSKVQQYAEEVEQDKTLKEQAQRIGIDTLLERLAVIADDIRRLMTERSANQPITGAMKQAREAIYPEYRALIMLLNAYVSSDGATLRTIKAEGAAGGTQVSPADIDTRQRLQKSYRAVANAAATDMLHYLRTNSDTYPEILEVVGADSNVRRRTPNNDGLKHSFRV